MEDPEVNEDKNLQPYQGQLFPKKGKRKVSNWWEVYTSRGEVREKEKYKTKANYGWEKTPSNTIIEYDSERLQP